MPGRFKSSKKRERDRKRLEEFLAKLCFICEDRTSPERSVPLPCCGKRLHESCLATWFKTRQGDYRCPHCRQLLSPYNIDEPFGPSGSGTPMAFQYVTFIPPVARQRYVHTWTEPVAPLGNLDNFVFSGGNNTPDWIPAEEEEDDHFYQAAYRPPPPGWAAALREIRSRLPPRQEDPNVVYRPG